MATRHSARSNASTPARLLAALLLSITMPFMAQAAAESNDLREFRVGMPVSALPAQGYVDLICANNPKQALSKWGDWASCPADANGLRAVGFRYEDSVQDGRSGETRVGGQPVTLALLIDDHANVARIRIETDPHVPLYLHKKAFLFGQQAKARYGEDGWSCNEQPPTEDEQPVGGVFVHEHCDKVTPSRHFIVERRLFRNPSRDLRAFTGASSVIIEPADGTRSARSGE